MFNSQIKTVLLLGGLTGILLGLGQLFGGTQGLVIGLLFAGGLNFFSYWFSDKIVLKIYKAKPADENKHSDLYHMIREIASHAKLPMPKIYVIETPQANAFATGRNPQHAAVAVTSGIMHLLNKNELKGVLAHEMSHIKNRDILISSVAATIAGVISYIAMIARWGAIFGGFGGGRNNDNGGILELLVLAIVAPIMALIIQMAISRSREFLADETGAKLIKDPYSLASALEKIEKNVDHFPFKKLGSTEATAHMFIHHPFKGKSLLNMFSTHPSTKERVQKLRAMKL
ncbi:protease HtpX [Candidatus Woesearchaeota archaeon CG10_big_fil_rev_8_21_14_0_10_32_24]|nr:MAG: protease HtpX [Candidatus Woesearchaeota archaeon CG10_big_fil_rev_8_21_14_0_10_32_24]